MQDVIPIKGLSKKSIKLLICKKKRRSNSFIKDSNIDLEIANTPKVRPRTRYAAIKRHHFRSHVENSDIKIETIDTSQQQVDIFTKPLPVSLFKYLRKLIISW